MNKTRFYEPVPGAPHIDVCVTDENRMVLHAGLSHASDHVAWSLHMNAAQARALAATLVKAADAAEAVRG